MWHLGKITGLILRMRAYYYPGCVRLDGGMVHLVIFVGKAEARTKVESQNSAMAEKIVDEIDTYTPG